MVETRITALNHYVEQEHPGNADVFSIANCPVLLYTSPLLETPNYLELVEASKVIAKKWNIELLDLNGDDEFNAKGRENLPLYMWDDLHPTRAGYELWWLPKFEEKIYSVIGRK